MLFKYVAFHYLKNMLIILMGLSGLFAGLDFLMNASSLPSFNIKILYAFFKWQEALSLLFPLAIVFGGIWTKISFIKQNSLSAMYSLGVTRKELFKPFFVVGVGTYLLFLGLYFSSFSTAKDAANQLFSNSYDVSETRDLFFKYNDSFVYIGALIPEKYKIENLTIFKMKNAEVIETFTSKEAWYNIHEWVATNVLKKTIVRDENGNQRLKIEEVVLLRTLEDYHPKILKSMYDNKSLTLYESAMAIKLLENQGLETHSLRAEIYGKVFMPLFSIALLMILLFNFPFHARYMNLAMTTTKAIGGTLFVWGVLFALQSIGKNGTLNPELSIILPIILLWTYALYSLGKSQKRI
jgi:lipopolysaccharide export system permease protein